MEISLQQLAKKYNKEWIFKDLTFLFKEGRNYALVGANGSGKSTLLQIISGYHLPSGGKIIYTQDGHRIPEEEVFRYISISAPYMELIEEFTLLEHLAFHFKFRKLREGYDIDSVVESCYLQNARHKYIKNFSSGMKQRLKLALSFYTESEIILLDEPTSNLDRQGTHWYQEQLGEITGGNSIIIIASNQSHEYEPYSPEIVDLQNYK